LVHLLGWPLLCFSAGVLGSVLADGVVTAVSIGVVLSIVMGMYISRVLHVLANVPYGFTACLCAVAMLALSRKVACRRR